MAPHPVQRIEDIASDTSSLAIDPSARDIIRTFRDAPELMLTHIGDGPDPYRDGATVVIYADTDGYEYWFDPDHDILVQAAPRASGDPSPRKTVPGRPLTVPELRERSLRIVERQIPDFATRRQYLHPLEANREGEIFFFRWDDLAAPLPESVLPPFVQIGLHTDGSLASFTNTLSG